MVDTALTAEVVVRSVLASESSFDGSGEGAVIDTNSPAPGFVNNPPPAFAAEVSGIVVHRHGSATREVAEKAVTTTGGGDATATQGKSHGGYG